MHTHPIETHRLAQLHQANLLAAADRDTQAAAARGASRPVNRIQHLIGGVLVRFGTRLRGPAIDVPLGTTSPAVR